MIGLLLRQLSKHRRRQDGACAARAERASERKRADAGKRAGLQLAARMAAGGPACAYRIGARDA